MTVSPILISSCSARGSGGRCRLPRISASFSPLPRSHRAVSTLGLTRSLRPPCARLLIMAAHP